jgi:mercuric ion binding protein
MKKSILILALLSSMNAFAGEKLEVTVKGMVCSFCSQGITKKFQEQGVRNVNVSLETHLVSLELNDNQKLDDGAIEKILKDAGYGVEKITRK